MTATPRSYEILEDTIRRDTLEVAQACGLSTSLISKWKEPHGDFTDSGARNPLDRIACVMETVFKISPERALLPLKWLAERFGFVLVPLPQNQKGLRDAHQHLMTLIADFGKLMQDSTAALEDGRITVEECRQLQTDGYELQEEVAIYLDAIEKAVADGR